MAIMLISMPTMDTLKPTGPSSQYFRLKRRSNRSRTNQFKTFLTFSLFFFDKIICLHPRVFTYYQLLHAAQVTRALCLIVQQQLVATLLTEVNIIKQTMIEYFDSRVVLTRKLPKLRLQRVVNRRQIGHRDLFAGISMLRAPQVRLSVKTLT